MRTRRARSVRPVEAAAEDLHAALAVSVEPIVATDDVQRIVFFNSAAERMFGYGAAEVLGRPFETLLPESWRERHRHDMARLAHSRDRSRPLGGNGRITVLRGDGVEVPAEGSIARARRDGHWTYTVVLRDTRERDRLAESQRLLAEVGAALAASLDCADTLNAFSRLAVEHIADLCVVALKEDECCPAHVVVAHREAGMEDLARASFAADPRRPAAPLREAMEAGVPSILPDPLRERLQPTETDPAELRRLLPDGSSGIVVPLMGRGRAIGALLLVAAAPRHFGWADLETAQELAQHAALAIDNDRLYNTARRALAAHEETISFVAHDLRNPLNVITMSAQLLKEGASLTDEATHRWLDAIAHSAERIDALISDLLTAARTSTGRPVLHTRPARVDLLIREAAGGHTDAAERKGVRLEVREPDETLRVVVDLDSTVRALSNLIGNALKFTPPYGTVVVAGERNGDEVLFTVSDTGSGIDPEHIPHIFDRFWQAPGTQRGGAGLGLAIVKGVVEAHHGRVWVESQLGRGTAFHFAIPLPDD